MERRSRSSRTSPAATLAARLSDAGRGAVYISEMDAPFEPFVLLDLANDEPKTVAAALARNAKPVTTVDPEQFFSRLTAARDWHGPRERKNIARITELRDVLYRELRDVRVVRAGRVQIDILIYGTAADGSIVGVRTKAVET